jgi:riboflavin kinase/FMN adenylyltransferase
MRITQIGGYRRPWDYAGAVVVLGEFDGFHLGHRRLLHDAGELARRTRSLLLAVVLADEAAPHHLTSTGERCSALLAAGADSALVISVDSEDGGGSASEVADEILRRLSPTTVVMACAPTEYESRYPSLRSAIAAHGIEIVEIERWTDPGGEVITSARVRDALTTGHIVQANDWLGRTFTLTGIVVHGSGLGRTIGFPTANLRLPDRQLVPMRGVYAAHVDLPDGTTHLSAVNIGVRPTVEHHGELLVEAHLLDFDEDIYDQQIDVCFRRWLRNEHRFDGVDQLVAQLQKDVLDTRLILQ